MKQFDVVRIERNRTLQEQVYQQMRDLIVSGKVAPGDKLPSTQRLAAQFNTHVPTVHAALTALAKEGLLARRPGKGTFVQKRADRLTTVAVLSFADAWGKDGSLYVQSVHAALRDELARRGIEMSVWNDPRPASARAEPWAPLVQAAAARKFQALIVTAAELACVPGLTRLPVPVALQSFANAPGCVKPDLGQFAASSLRALARQGCRSVGLIATMRTDPVWLTAGHPQDDFFGTFIDVSRELGLAVRNEWMRVPSDDRTSGGRSEEAFGYEQFHELWRQPERPEGLVVLYDTAVRGAILGVREEQVRVPETLKLVLSKNEAIDLLCPVPATFVVNSERQVARALIAQVEKQFRGERCEPIHLPYRLVAHRGNSQQPTNQPPTKGRQS